MADAAPGQRPGHLQLSELDIALEPGSGGQPLRPLVQGLRLHVSDQGLRELMQALVAEADRRAPLDVRLTDLMVGPEGIDLVLRIEKSILRGDLSTRLVLSAPGGEALRVELTNSNVPAWVPLEMLLEEAVKRSGGAVRRDPAHRGALLLDPATLLARAGVPARFAPGRWDVATSPAGIDLTFRERAAAA